jgi:hypothetical protein
MDRPRAKAQELISEPLDSGLVVYDRDTQVAHSLTADATTVWRMCDGTRSVSEIAAQCGLEVPVVQRAIDELSACGLLKGTSQSSERISRREGARRLARAGGAAFAAPLIYSVAISPAMAAASTCSSNCADYVQIAASACDAPSPATSGSASACQSGTCYWSATGNTYTCAPAGCLGQGRLNCAGNNYAGPCCAGPSACQYVTPEMAYGCYS